MYPISARRKKIIIEIPSPSASPDLLKDDEEYLKVCGICCAQYARFPICIWRSLIFSSLISHLRTTRVEPSMRTTEVRHQLSRCRTNLLRHLRRLRLTSLAQGLWIRNWLRRQSSTILSLVRTSASHVHSRDPRRRRSWKLCMACMTPSTSTGAATDAAAESPRI